MTTLDPRTFDATRTLAMAAFGTLKGHDLDQAAPVTIVDEPSGPGEVTADEAIHLWSSGRVVYTEDARPTPVETPEAAAERLTEMEPLDNGYFLIRAPWLGEGEKVHGLVAATERRQEVIAAGVAAYTSTAAIAGHEAAAGALGGDGFEMKEAGSNGYYEITGPGMDEPEKVRGKANAEQRLAELRGAASGVTTTEVDQDADATQ